MARRRFQMVFAPGERVRVTGGPWDARIGCEGVVVAPPADGTYPQPGPGETLILLDADPLSNRPSKEWTCCIGNDSLHLVAGQPMTWPGVSADGAGVR